MLLFSKCLNYITNIMLTSIPWSLFIFKVIFTYLYLFLQTNWLSVVDDSDVFFSSTKMPQLLSNLFINVIDNNGGFFFHSFSKVPQFFSNLPSVVDENDFLMF
jgi:hypothetical protein